MDRAAATTPERVAGESVGGESVAGDRAIEWVDAPGLTDYQAALERMERRAAAIRAGEAAEGIWLVEHPALYTAGTSARAEHLLGASDLPTFRSGRGGQWTYHGPGQRVAYLMLDLKRRHGAIPPRDLRAFVAGLEAWVIAALGRFGVQGERRAGRIGIWVVDPTTGREAKIAAIGVRVSRWVTTHGLAINVVPDLGHYAGIVPCGISEHGVTSLRALGVDAGLGDVDSALRETFSGIFGDAAGRSAA